MQRHVARPSPGAVTCNCVWPWLARLRRPALRRPPQGPEPFFRVPIVELSNERPTPVPPVPGHGRAGAARRRRRAGDARSRPRPRRPPRPGCGRPRSAAACTSSTAGSSPRPTWAPWASMRFDTATPEREAFAKVFDVCVIGSGPAGITLARRLAARGLEVALMEAGDIYWSEESQGIYVGEITGLPYHDLDMARLRYFGGTSGHWNGACPDLDAASFLPNPLNGTGDGWPIRKADLDPYRGGGGRHPRPDRARAGGHQPARPDRRPPGRPSGATARRPGSARNISTRSPPPTGSGSGSTPTSSTSGSIRASTAVTEAVFRSYAPDDPGFTVEARASTRSAPAASRTRGSCSISTARCRAASATRTTRSAATSATIQASSSARCCSRRRRGCRTTASSSPCPNSAPRRGFSA